MDRRGTLDLGSVRCVNGEEETRYDGKGEYDETGVEERCDTLDYV